jgi:uncharacterized protein YajQ (UPF0234 family)
MAKNSSFDIVSEIDFQEADNAVNQAIKEIHQRYDLKDSATEIELNKKDKLINLNTKDDYSRKQSIDILQTKFIKRGLSIKVMKLEEPEPAASGRLRQKISLQSGISKENAKIITKMIKEMNVKVSAQIMDERIRVQGAKKDDLQIVIQKVKEAELDFPVQFLITKKSNSIESPNSYMRKY